MSRNRAAVLAAVLVMMLMLPACALGDDLIDDSLLVPETANYDTFTVEYGDYIKSASAGGYQVFPVEQHLSVKEGTARIVKLNIARNANVKAGDVLVTYEKEGSRAELESMKLTLQRTQESFELGKQERSESIRTLKSDMSDITDSYALKQAKIRLQQAQLDYEQYVFECEYDIRNQQKSIDELTEFFDDTQIVAPFDGIVTDLTTKGKGDTIYAGETLITLQSQDTYYIGIDNSNGNFRYGMSVSVGLGPRNKKTYLDGRVISAANILPNETKPSYALIEVYGEVTESGLRNISVESNTIELKHVLLLPRKALSLSGGKTYVSILDGDMVQKRIVVSGHNTSSDTWVLQGLDERQQVILD